MKIFEILLVSIDLWTNFFIFSLASGAQPSEQPTSPYFEKPLNFSLNFRKKFDKIIKPFSKNRKYFLRKFQKCYIFIDYFNIFWKSSSLKKRENFDFSKGISNQHHSSRDLPKRKILYNLLYLDSHGYIPVQPQPPKLEEPPSTGRNSCVDLSNVIHYPPKNPPDSPIRGIPYNFQTPLNTSDINRICYFHAIWMHNENPRWEVHIFAQLRLAHVQIAQCFYRIAMGELIFSQFLTLQIGIKFLTKLA